MCHDGGTWCWVCVLGRHLDGKQKSTRPLRRLIATSGLVSSREVGNLDLKCKISQFFKVAVKLHFYDKCCRTNSVIWGWVWLTGGWACGLWVLKVCFDTELKAASWFLLLIDPAPTSPPQAPETTSWHQWLPETSGTMVLTSVDLLLVG